uniref:ADP-ribosylation factor-like protein 16 n=1 Tax=Phallusia mammillata TaxID=59560 RepID=A0A6F9D7A6_9ASCI|nr:ADP-ribosylation factor-like protein 16 [Phallusia mammillata]
MAPIWKSYFDEAKGIIFVIDVSNPQQISVASIQLKEVLAYKLPTLVVLNKSDILSVTSVNEMKYLLRLNQLFLVCESYMSVVETSCQDKTGFQDIFKWLRTF